MRVDERVKDNNKRDEQRCGEKERENASARYPSIDAVHREEYSIRWPNIFLFFFFYSTIYGEKNRVLEFEEERIFLVIEFLY